MAKILVIEDNPKHSFLFIDILSEEGYEVATAQNGDEVKEKINTQNKDNLYDLLLVDISVPVFDAIEFIRTYLNKYRIIVVSSYADTQEIAVIIDKKWRIKKPFDTNSLLRIIKDRIELPIRETQNAQ